MGPSKIKLIVIIAALSAGLAHAEGGSAGTRGGGDAVVCFNQPVFASGEPTNPNLKIILQNFL